MIVDNVFLDIQVDGESSGEVFAGTFEVKLFLTHREQTDVSRLLAKSTLGLDKSPVYALEPLKEVLARYVDGDKVGEMAREIATAALVQEDHQVRFMRTLIILSKHIVKAPTWWVTDESGIGGLNLVDCKPIYALYSELGKAQAAFRDRATAKPA